MQGALTAFDGVTSAEISLEEQRVVVVYSPGAVTPVDLTKAIERVGFKAAEELPAKEEEENDS